MRVVALLTVRNEARYLARCLQHFYEQGVETCVIDHGSEDESRQIAEGFRDRGVIGIETLAFDGVFSLEAQLRHKEELAATIAADWFIHLDADEIRQAPPPYRTLKEGIAAVDQAGWNAIDFAEFVFTPTAEQESFEGLDYVAAMRWYYYYEPESPDRHRINAWKMQPAIDLTTHAGHQVLFPGRRVCPQPFILRHYPMLSRAHALAKYGDRRFAAAERARQWHSDRVVIDANRLRWPPRSRLKHLDASETFDSSDPWRRHFWMQETPSAFSPARTGDPPVAPTQPSGLRALQAFKAAQGDDIPTIAPAAAGPRPFWSVMVPTFDPQPEYLRLTLIGVLEQDPGPDEMQIEVVDDASVDVDVAGIVAEVGQGRIDFYRQPANGGLAANWNACLQRARGEWVHILHQDDRVLPGFYRRLRPPCQTMPDLAAAFCRGAGMDATDQVVWVQEPERETAGILVDFTARLAAEQRVLTPCIVVRRRAYEQIGGYHLGLPYCADWDMYKRLAVYGPIWYEPISLACWRQHEDSTSARLRHAGADLIDRQRSIELSRAYLPAADEARARPAALRGSLVWAADILRQSLLHDDFETAWAQSRAIADVLQQAASEHGGLDRQQPATETTQLRARIDELEAQVRAWTLAAQRLGQEPLSGRAYPRNFP